jgi:hypothetical protein
MIIPVLASSSLIVLSSTFVFALTEHSLRKKYGDGFYDSSFYAKNLPVFASFISFLMSLHFVGGVMMSTFVTNVAILSTILSVGYYVTFRGILLFTFSRRFSDILKNRYNINEKHAFEGCTVRSHPGDVASIVANHLISQINTSNRVAIPIGIVWVIFVFTSILYLPAFWIQAFIISGLCAISLSMACTLLLLPDPDCEKSVSPLKSSPLGHLVPPMAFLGLFTILTPLAFELQSALPLIM